MRPLSDSFGIVTLGCARNSVDSEKVASDILARGGVLSSPQKARTVILNTCGFTREAKEESLAALRDLIALKAGGRIERVFVRGCLVKRYLKELKASFPEVDRFDGLADFKDRFLPGARLTKRPFAYLKISEGCGNRCTYCAIPGIKGPLKSRPLSSIILEAKALEAQGTKEIVVIGQDITRYGEDRSKSVSRGVGLVACVRAILKETSIPWVRLLYLHPRRLSDDVIDLIASEPRVLRYVDLPVQHASDRILKRMGRGTTRRFLTERIRRLRTRLPGAALRTSLIVGFPTETKRDFRELCDFVEEVRFDRCGVFVYSREEGTPAFRMEGQVSMRVKEERRGHLMALQAAISRRKLKEDIGRTLDVLIEGRGRKGTFTGRSYKDAPEVDGRVSVHSTRPLRVGGIVSCRITFAGTHDLRGEAIS